MGYGRGVVWVKVILPQVYPLIRLPVFAVLAFSLSVVDMAVILGPSNPPTLAVAITRWAFAPDTAMLLPAAAAALLLAGIAGAGIAAWIAAERLAARGPLVAPPRRARARAEPGLRAATSGLARSLVARRAVARGAGALVRAWRWSFPGALPESWSAPPGRGTDRRRRRPRSPRSASLRSRRSPRSRSPSPGSRARTARGGAGRDGRS
jgi:putative thiamine transport system permease protein